MRVAKTYFTQKKVPFFNTAQHVPTTTKLPIGITVWPDVGIKSSPQFYKSTHGSFNLKIMFFKIAKYLGYFCKKVCHQEL